MFLGGADGNAELRSPPLKNALRYWWRITQGDTPKDKLLAKEQFLFGGVNEDKSSKPEMKACRSLVDVVVTGEVKTEKQGSTVNIGAKNNPEVQAHHNPVSLSGYLGMGPISMRGNKYEKMPIKPGEKFTLSITFPKDHEEEILEAVSLFAHFGALGARSKNGWGSIRVISQSKEIELPNISSVYRKYGAELNEIFQIEKKYPFKLGLRKNGDKSSPLLWKIKYDGKDRWDKWEDAMKAAAWQYMDVRQTLKFPKEKPQGVQQRHIIGYPVTGHAVSNWGGNNGRMPSQLRIVIRKQGEE
ncbi:MAG: hypothetical protein HQK65_08150, partial [Desulfamplus sp.]|nr:hypothetical protein [Desulfamplus sp.]